MKMILLYFICPLITLNILAVLGELVTLSACFLRFLCPKSIFIYSFSFCWNIYNSDLYCFAGNDVQHYDEMESCCKSLIIYVKKREITKYAWSLNLFFSLQGGSLEIQQPASLQERLLCVETSETSADTVRMVVEVVASFAPFVGFLPLANRVFEHEKHLHFEHHADLWNY